MPNQPITSRAKSDSASPTIEPLSPLEQMQAALNQRLRDAGYTVAEVQSPTGQLQATFVPAPRTAASPPDESLTGNVSGPDEDSLDALQGAFDAENFGTRKNIAGLADLEPVPDDYDEFADLADEPLDIDDEPYGGDDQEDDSDRD